MISDDFLSWCIAFLAILCFLFTGVFIVCLCFICKYYYETMGLDYGSYKKLLKKDKNGNQYDIEMELPDFSRFTSAETIGNNENRFRSNSTLRQEFSFDNDEVFHYDETS
ncbi:hypothetical protein L5515_009226 [Caenorhabditis briggsae]|uniref:Uncharacterized protein n=1 Tax=Caenorhabditis briggsae TaxID=6238 RepID=A0AAE9JNF6_CAEBR|nr:hypothetical protein L5515_009226 [Caenorhabditis briggsae]